MTEQTNQRIQEAAAKAAALGRYQAALSILRRAPDQQVLPVLQLRAKIYAQQGRYDEAITQWDKVLSIAPNNPEAKEGIQMAKSLQKHQAGGFYLRANLYYAILLLLIVGLSAALGYVGFRLRAKQDRSLQMFFDTQREQQRLTTEVVDALKLATTEADKRTASKIGDLEQQLAALADRLEQTQNARSLAFEQMAQTLRSTGAEVHTLKSAVSLQQQHHANSLNNYSTHTAELQTRLDELSTTLNNAVTNLQAKHTEAVDSLTYQLWASLNLSEDIRDLADQYGRLSRKFWGPSKHERQLSQQRLDRLADRAEVLTWQMSMLVDRPATVTSPQTEMPNGSQDQSQQQCTER